MTLANSDKIILDLCGGTGAGNLLKKAAQPKKSPDSKETELMRMAVRTWGTESQLDMVIEECAELIDAIQKWRRRRVESAKVLEEAVDVELCVAHLKLMLDAPDLWEQTKMDKLRRLERRMKIDS